MLVQFVGSFHAISILVGTLSLVYCLFTTTITALSTQQVPKIMEQRGMRAIEPVLHVVQNGRGVVSNHEQDILQWLLIGQGITLYKEIGLIEKCGNCNRLFIGSGLRAHIRACCE